MPSSNTLRRAGALIIALAATEAFAQVPPPVAPALVPAAAPAAPAAPATQAVAEQVTTGTLKQLEQLQREKAVAELKKQIAELNGPKIDATPLSLPPAMPAQQAGAPAFFQGGPAPLLAPEESIDHQVLSIISFRGETQADVMNGDTVSTVRVGDKLGSGKVVAIDLKEGVSVEMKTPVPAVYDRKGKVVKPETTQLKRITLPRAMSARETAQPAVSVAPPPIPQRPPVPAGTNGGFADAVQASRPTR